jgi:hypothetical protein
MVALFRLQSLMVPALVQVAVSRTGLSGLRISRATWVPRSRTTLCAHSFLNHIPDRKRLIIATKVSGAVINVTLWPSKAGQTDFLHEGTTHTWVE